MSKSKEYGEQLYEAAVLTAGAVGVSYASRNHGIVSEEQRQQREIEDTLGVPMTLSGSAKLALAFGLSAIGIKMLKDKKVLPDNPFKT